jgi:hypothetical protein
VAPALVETYDRHDYEAEMREAFEALSAHYKSLMRVVALRPRRRA